MITYGTDYFVNRQAAIDYYAPYGYEAADIDDKIAHGEIHIGKPPLTRHQIPFLIRDEMRWGIREV